MAGFAHGGLTSWRQERQPVSETERLPAAELARRLVAGEQSGLQLLDVRERREWDAGHVPGSVLTPWHDVAAIPAGLDPARTIAVVCALGVRAATAASLLKLYGAEHVVHVVDSGVPRLEQEVFQLFFSHVALRLSLICCSGKRPTLGRLTRAPNVAFCAIRMV